MSYKVNALCPVCEKTRTITKSSKQDVIAKCRHCGKLTNNYRSVMANGYIRVRNYEKNKYEYEHRYVWESNYGHIPKGYVIHHIDGDRTNNDINNLEILTKERHDRITLNENAKNQIRKSFKLPNQKDFCFDLLSEKLNSGKSIRQISRDLNVTHGTIRRNMRDYNLKKPIVDKKQNITTKKTCKDNVQKIVKDQLALLLTYKLSQRKIAEIYSVSHTTIQRKIKEYGL